MPPTLRRAAWLRPVTATAALVAVAVGWQVSVAWNAAVKLSPELRGALAERGRANVAVEIPFVPEKFHMVYFQERGRLVRADGRRLYLRDVTAEEVRRIAGEYWVADIRLWRPD